MTWLNIFRSTAILALIACSPAQAQLVNPFGTDVVGISPDDATRIKAAIRSVLQQYTRNARHDWQSADSTRTGTATITEIFSNAQGQRCAMVRHEFTKGPGHPYYAPMCEVTTDEWRIAF